MHTRVIVAVVLVAFLGIVIAGCSTTTSSVYPATFDAYDTEPVEQSTPTDGSYISPFAAARRELTGYAYVKLEDGTRIKADCPILDLERGALVDVQQNADGTWVVLRTR